MNDERKGTPRSIQFLEKNANNGNILSMFELYLNHKDEKNEEISEKYLSDLQTHLSNNHPKLHSISLYNFKCFKTQEKAIEIHFHEKLTVIIGNNGSGKTSIAEAIAKGFSWINNNLMRSDVSANPITTEEINSLSKDYAEIELKLLTEKKKSKNTISFSIKKSIDGYKNTVRSEPESSKKLGKIYRTVTGRFQELSVPLLAFYSVETRNKTIDWKKLIDKQAKPHVESRFSAINGAIEAGADPELFYSGYITLSELSKIEQEQEKTLQTELKKLNEILEKQKDNELIKLEIEETKIKIEKEKKNQQHSIKLSFLNKAIKRLVDNIQNIEVRREQKGMIIYAETCFGRIHIAQLSHGQKALMALLGDLFFRFSELNPHLQNPLESPGIVVIDEIELHLHPEWQQKVLIALQEICPNIQWIVTTHSPQVLSTIQRENIQRIDVGNEGEITITRPLAMPYGTSSGDVLQSVMLVDPVPPISEKSDLQRLTVLVDQGAYGDEEAVRLMNSLQTSLGATHPQLQRIQRSIDRQKILNS